MTFSIACVGIVIVLLILIGTCFIGIVSGSDDDRSGFIIAWVLSSIGFGVCLTALLVQNGII